jgi:hypothetical protein
MLDFALPPIEFSKPAIIRPATEDLLRYGGDPMAAMLPGLMPVIASGKMPTYQLVHTTAATIGDSSSFTLSSVALGAEDPSRVLVIAMGARGSGGASRDFSGVAIGASNFTIDRTAGSVSNATVVARLAYPTGTSANIDVTMSGSINRIGVAVYALYNLRGNAPVVNSAEGSASSASVGVNVAASGIAIFAACSSNTGAMSWTGATEDYDVSAASVHRFSSASLQPATAQSPLNGVVTFGGSNIYSVSAAAYR